MLSISNTDINSFLSHMAYGKINPSKDDYPIYARSSTLLYYKKAISAFHPNVHMQWDTLARKGNPTKCPQISKLINDIKQKEVRRQGKPSCAKRDLTQSEFEGIIFHLRSNSTVLVKYSVSSFLSFNLTSYPG